MAGNPIASLFAQLGFRYDRSKLQAFQKDLKTTARQIDSKQGLVGSYAKADKSQQQYFKSLTRGFQQTKPNLIESRRQLARIRKAFQDNQISHQQYVEGRRRGLMTINKLEQEQHIRRMRRQRELARASGPFAGGQDPRQAGNHRLISAIHSDLGLATIAGGFAIAQSSRAYQELIGVQQGINAAMGDVERGGQEMQWLIDTSNRLGISLSAAADGYKGLAAATKGSNLEGKETRRIFEAVASYSKVLNLSLDDQKGVFRALTQMQSKGIVNAEELSQQFGERLPGGFEAAARAMEMTTGELRKATEQGEVTAEELFPKLSKELMIMAKSGGQLEEAMKNTNSALNRFSNNVILANARMNEAGLDKGIRNIFNTMSEAIMRAMPIWETLGKIFNVVLSSLEGPIEFFGMLGEKLGLATDESGEFTTQFKLLVGVIVGAVKPFRRIAAALFLMGLFIPAITDTIDEGFDGWNDFFTKMAIWAAGAAILASALAKVAGAAKRAKDVFSGGSGRTRTTAPGPSPQSGGGSARGGAVRALTRKWLPALAAYFGYEQFEKFNAANQGDPLIFKRQQKPLFFNPEEFSGFDVRERMRGVLEGPSTPGMPSSFGPAGMFNQGSVSVDTINIEVSGSDDPDSVAERVYQRFTDTIRETSLNEQSQEK